jgi:hypothetical protein
MSEIQTPGGGFAGEPAAALSVAGSAGCCGNPPQAAATSLPEGDAVGSAPCCGTAAQARESAGCCGTAAKAEAVAGGSGCCG